MNYQGEQVNFSQVSNDQLLSALQATNRQVAVNGDNLVQMGIDMTEMGVKQRKIGVDIGDNSDNIEGLQGLVNQLTNVWQKTVGLVNTNTNAIKTNSENLVQIGIDHENMGTGGGGNPFGLSTLALGAAGLGAYLLLRKK